MATMTLAEARVVVANHLDDDGTRWTSTGGTGGGNEIDDALKSALSRCLSDYVAAGGERLSETVSTTSDSSGQIDLSTYDPLRVSGVSIQSGSRFYPVSYIDPENVDILETVTRTAKVRLTRNLALPTTSTQPIVGIGATEAGSWDAFDHWICARAARQLAVKDDEAYQALSRLEEDLGRSCILSSRVAPAARFPMPGRFYSKLVRWTWLPRSKTLQFCKSWRF